MKAAATCRRIIRDLAADRHFGTLGSVGVAEVVSVVLIPGGEHITRPILGGASRRRRASHLCTVGEDDVHRASAALRVPDADVEPGVVGLAGDQAAEGVGLPSHRFVAVARKREVGEQRTQIRIGDSRDPVSRNARQLVLKKRASVPGKTCGGGRGAEAFERDPVDGLRAAAADRVGVGIRVADPRAFQIGDRFAQGKIALCRRDHRPQ